MKYTITDLKDILEHIENEQARLNREVDRKKYMNLPSEIEPGKYHRIELPRSEYLRLSKDSLDQLRRLKEDKSTLQYMLKELEDQEARSLEFKKKEVQHPSNEVVDLRSDSDPPPVAYKFDPDDWMLSKDFAAVASRRAVRLEKIAACSCGELNSDDNTDYMAHQNATTVLEQSEFIADHIGEMVESGDRLEDWLEDKLSKIADDVDEVYKYLRNGGK